MAEATLTSSLRDALTLAQAAHLFAPVPHVATIWRWATRGTRGVRLASWTVGGRRVTTPQAVEEFLQTLNSAAPVTESADDSARRAREAGAALEKMGC